MDSREHIIRLAKKLTPSLRYDLREDYEAWRQRAAGVLYGLLGLPYADCPDCLALSEPVDRGDYVRRDFTFQSEEGYFVPGALLVPKGISLPAATAICIQGHTTGMHISLGEEKYAPDKAYAQSRDFALQATKQGFCAVILEQRYMGTCGQNLNGSAACVASGAAMPALLLGRCAIGERVWDVQKLLDLLERHFTQYVDTKRIFAVGNSGGGTTSLYAACVDKRIGLAVVSCAICEFEDSIIPLHHCSCNYIPGIRRFFEMGDLASLLAEQKLLIICGAQDPDFPLVGVQKSYERAKEAFCSQNREWAVRMIIGEDGHQFYPEQAWPQIRQMVYR